MRLRWQFNWLFEPRDIWIGVFWKRYPKAVEFYVCVVPMLPFRIYVQDYS